MPQTFIADAMLKKLARWLRIFGVDVEFADIPDNQILALLDIHRGRALLTQDVQLHGRAIHRGFKSFLVPRDLNIEGQLAAVYKEFSLNLEDFPSKTVCPSCNGPLNAAKKSEVKEKVLENVYASRRKFWLCGKCGKAYWEGSHWKRINETAREIKKMLKEGKRTTKSA